MTPAKADCRRSHPWTAPTCLGAFKTCRGPRTTVTERPPDPGPRVHTAPPYAVIDWRADLLCAQYHRARVVVEPDPSDLALTRPIHPIRVMPSSAGPGNVGTA